MAVPTYGTPGTATIVQGKIFQPESRVRWNGTLESSSWLSSSVTYNAPVGFTNGTGLDLGLISALGFSSVPTFTPIEQINFKEDVLLNITGEETFLSLTLKQLTPEIINAALGTGIINYFSGGAEVQITFGGLCSPTPVPLVVEWKNITCGVSTPYDVRTQIGGGILTLYKTYIDSGFPLNDITAKNEAEVALRFRVLADTSRQAGNRLGNLYLY